MSRKKSEHRKKAPLTKPNKLRPEHDQNESSMYVHGAVEAHPPESLLKQHTAERKEDATIHVAERKEDREIESKKMLLEGLTLLFVIVYAGLTAWQACLTRSIAKTAALQAALVDKQTRISVRPWIGIEDSDEGFSAGPLSFDASGNAVVNYHLRTKNFGSYPAQGVHPRVELWPIRPSDDLFQKERDACSRHMEPKFGNDQFPGNQRFTWDTFVPFSAPDLKKYDVPSVKWSLFVCIYYRDQFGETPYHTGYTYRLVSRQNAQQPIDMDPRLDYRSVTYDGVWALFHSSID